MKRRYDYFDYKLPDKPAQFYADNAIKILRQLIQKFPDQTKKNFLCPSEVLTLSGVRAFDTYYQIGPHLNTHSTRALKNLLRANGIWMIDEAMDFAGEPNKNRRYSLVNAQAFKELGKRYKNIASWVPLDLTKVTRDVDFMTWWWAWQSNIAMEAMRDNNEMIKKWMKMDWYAPLNITFGMLLGYPGEAICSVLWDEDDIWTHNIKHADKFDAARPIYAYSKKLKKNKTIQAHIKLWSDILDIVYSELKV